MLLGVVNIAREAHFKHNESYNFKYKPLTSTVNVLDWISLYEPLSYSRSIALTDHF